MRYVTAVLISALTVVGLMPGQSGRADSPRAEYLSLGDSLAASMQPDADGRDRTTAEGFSERVLRSRQHHTPGLTLVKLGRGGETAASMITSPKGGPSQLELAEQHLRAAPVEFVTIDIGANEVERCASGSGFDSACVRQNLTSLRQTLPRIIARLRAAGGDGLRIVGINYYNSFLGRWVNGQQGRQLARGSVWVEHQINATLAHVYARAHVPVADVESKFETRTFGRFLKTRSYGPLPVAVAKTCIWTWACSARYDDHTNSRGYRVIAQSVLELLR